MRMSAGTLLVAKLIEKLYSRGCKKGQHGSSSLVFPKIENKGFLSDR